MVAGNVDQVAAERLQLRGGGGQRHWRLGSRAWNRCSRRRRRRSHRCKRARIRRRIQENVVTRVDQHLKHLKRRGKQNKINKKSEGEERGWRHRRLGQIPYRAPPGSRWSHTCPSVPPQGCGWLWGGCEGSSAGSSSTSAAQVFYTTADVIIIIILKSPSGLDPNCTKFNILLLVSPHPSSSPIRGRILQRPLHRHLIESDILSVLQLDGRRAEGEGVGVGGSSCQRDQGWRRALLQLGYAQAGCKTRGRNTTKEIRMPKDENVFAETQI